MYQTNTEEEKRRERHYKNKNTYNLFKLLSPVYATTQRDFKKSHHTKYGNISYLEH